MDIYECWDVDGKTIYIGRDRADAWRLTQQRANQIGDDCTIKQHKPDGSARIIYLAPRKR